MNRLVFIVVLFVLTVGVSKAQVVTLSGRQCSDVGLNSALASLPSTGGIVDASGCRGIEPISSTVTIGANQEVRFSKGSEWQPQSPGLTMFSIKAGATIRGLWADVSNQTNFSGQVLHFGDNYGNATHTTVDDILCTGGSPAAGNCIFMTASNLSMQSIAFVSVSNVHCTGYHVCLSMNTSGNGFVNGNLFSNITATYSAFGYALNATGGSIEGNLFSNVSYQCCASSGTSYGIYFEGPAPIQHNIFSSAVVWDTTGLNLPIDNTSAGAHGNFFLGRFDGTVTDSRDDYIDEESGVAQFNSLMQRVGFGNSFGLGSNGLLFSVGPTISSGFGTSASVAASNGTGAFTVNVGTGGVARSGILRMPHAAKGWACQISDMSTKISTREVGYTVDSVSFAAESPWHSGDVLLVTCGAF